MVRFKHIIDMKVGADFSRIATKARKISDINRYLFRHRMIHVSKLNGKLLPKTNGIMLFGSMLCDNVYFVYFSHTFSLYFLFTIRYSHQGAPNSNIHICISSKIIIPKAIRSCCLTSSPTPIIELLQCLRALFAHKCRQSQSQSMQIGGQKKKCIAPQNFVPPNIFMRLISSLSVNFECLCRFVA